MEVKCSHGPRLGFVVGWFVGLGFFGYLIFNLFLSALKKQENNFVFAVKVAVFRLPSV